VHIAYYFPRDLNSDRPTGDRTIARDLIAGLRSAGHTVTVASEFEAQFFWRNPRRLAILPGALLSAFRVVRATRPDVWLTQGPDRKVPDVIGPLVCLATGTPYVVYDTPGTKAYAKLRLAEGRGRHLWTVLPGFLAQKLAFLTADRLITAKGKDHRYHKASRLTGRKLAHRSPGVPTDLFRPLPEEGHRLRARWQLPSDCLVVLAVSRLAASAQNRKTRSVVLLAEAFAALGDEGLDARLVVVGHGPGRPHVEAALEPLGDRVMMLGHVDRADLPAIYSAADVFAFPGLDEPIGMVYLEAQACGLPVVAFDNAGVSEVVATGVTGLLVAPGDVGALADALVRLARDRALREEMSRAAADMVRDRFDRHAWIEAVVAELNRARDRRRSRRRR
jgi:glycosyltransferase involved in cell wall biosynthesis